MVARTEPAVRSGAGNGRLELVLPGAVDENDVADLQALCLELDRPQLDSMLPLTAEVRDRALRT